MTAPKPLSPAARAILARWGRPAAPPAPEPGEVGELLAALGSKDRWMQLSDAQLDRAATLLQQQQHLLTLAGAELDRLVEQQAAPAPEVVPVAEGPKDEELDTLERRCWKLDGVVEHEPGQGFREVFPKEETFDHRAFARAVLSRWGRPAAPPAPGVGEVVEVVAELVSERLPDLRQNLEKLIKSSRAFDGYSTMTPIELADRIIDAVVSWHLSTLLQQQEAELAALRSIEAGKSLEEVL